MHAALRSPLIRQFTGAVVGAMVALALYTVGSWAVEKVQAMLPSDMMPHQEFTEETRNAKMDRIAAAAKEQADKYVEEEK